MDTLEQFRKVFYLAHGSARMDYAQNLQLRRAGSELGFLYSSWEKTREQLSECEPGSQAEKLKARLARIEADYMQARRVIEEMIVANASRPSIRTAEEPDSDDSDEFILHLVETRLARLNSMADGAAGPIAAAGKALQTTRSLLEEAAPEESKEEYLPLLQTQLRGMYCEISAFCQTFNSLQEPLAYPAAIVQLHDFINNTDEAFGEKNIREAAQLLAESLEAQLRNMKDHLSKIEAEKESLENQKIRLCEKLEKRAAED